MEVVELDRDPTPSAATSFGNRPNRWAVLFGILAVALLGLSLLPTAEVEPVSADATLSDPAVATTVVGNQPRQIAFIGGDAFPLRAVSGIKGFVNLTGPVEFHSKWWMIGNRPGPTSSAVVLGSEDGRSWEEVGLIASGPEQSIRVDQLTVFEDALLAVGSEGTSVGPSFLSMLAGNLALWRSGDGARWAHELVHESEDHIAFVDTNLAISGKSVLVRAVAISTTAAEAAERLPSYVVPPLEEGRFSLIPHGFRLLVYGPLRIEVASVPLTSVTLTSSIRLFRSDAFTDWSEIDVGFNMNGGIVAAPDGGFIGSSEQGIAFSSAYGTNWSPNARADAAFYQQWGDRLLGFSYDPSGLSLEIIDADGRVQVQLPSEMDFCSVGGSNELLAAACPTLPAFTPRVVQWQSNELTESRRNGLVGLELTDPSTSVVRQFPIAPGQGRYDLETDTIALADTQGIDEAFPVDVLAQLRQSPASFRHDVLLSRDGLNWSPGQSALWSYELVLLGGIDEGFLFATRSNEPGATLIVSAGDL